jgi:hypothetical protein
MKGLFFMNYYDQLVHAYTFNNIGLLAISAITFAFGFWEYIYSFRIALREKKSPFPLWMHTFYVAHDSSFAVLFLIQAYLRNWNWFCTGVSIALFVWNGFELVCLHLSVRDERQEIFGDYIHGTVSKSQARLLILAQIIAMYGVVWMVLLFMGHGAFFQWTCMTNMVMAAGPTTLWLRRKDRTGMSMGLALVILAGTINNFLPGSMFLRAVPEAFNHPVYFITGVIYVLIALANVFIVRSKPKKKIGPDGKKPIW